MKNSRQPHKKLIYYCLNSKFVELQVKYTRDVEKIKYNREGDAAIDLRASGVWAIELDISQKEIEQPICTINPGQRILVKTGVALAIPKGHWGSIRDRSGLALNCGIHCLGGVIDENYRGEIGVVVLNLGTKPVELKKNDRIAQIIISPYTKTTITEVQEHSQTTRNCDGFGSSGR